MKRRSSLSRRAFTVVELLVAMAVMLGIVAIMMSATGQAGQILQRTSGKIEQFGEARRAFESVTRRLSEATLNTYWDYVYTTAGTSRYASGYVRQSELRFRSGPMTQLVPGSSVYRPAHGVFFQAPFGEAENRTDSGTLDTSLNTWGFFLEVDSDAKLRPSFLPETVPLRRRARLMELREATEQLSVYSPPDKGAPHWWFAESVDGGANRPVHVLAENIVAFAILPRLSNADELARGKGKPVLCPKYDYDSTRTSNYVPVLNPPDPEVNPKNQLPPVVQVVMVAIDERSAARLAHEHADRADLGIETDDLFHDSAKLEDNPQTPEPGDGDLATLEARLRAQNVTYRIFSSNVAIRGAKWSKSQLN